MKPRLYPILVLAVVLIYSQHNQLAAQCSAGDILWTSDAVNANVGTAAGGGTTDARCATSTVAGAAYNDPTMPFGIQGAMDCACQGATVRILHGANSYDSSSASWNNRFNAAKEVVYNFTPGGSSNYNAIFRIEGWADTSTRCEDFGTTNCPVEMDFSGGSGEGVRPATNLFSVLIQGLWVHDAASNCIVTWAISVGGIIASRANDCGGFGLHTLGAWSPGVNLYAHDNDDVGMVLNTLGYIGEAHGNGGTGMRGEPTTNAPMSRMLSYNNDASQSGFTNFSGRHMLSYWHTLYGNENGWSGSTGTKEASGIANIVSVNNTVDGIQDYNPNSKALFSCIAAYGNGTLDIDPNPSNLKYIGLRGYIDNGVTPITFPDVPVFIPSPGVCEVAENCGSFIYPGTDTAVTDIPGAAPGCGGGLTIQPVRRP